MLPQPCISAPGEAGLGAGFFQSPVYVRTWRRYLSGEPGTDRAAASLSDLPPTCLPLVEVRERIAGLERRIWSCAGWDAAWYPYSFLPANREGAVCYLEYLQKHRSEWDAVVTCGPSDALDVLTVRAQDQSFDVIGRRDETLPFVSLPGGWEAYWGTRSPNLRKNLRSLANRASREGLVCRSVTAESDVEALLARLFDLHQIRWADRGQQSRYRPGTRRRSFLEALVASLESEGEVWLPHLMAGASVVAVALCFLDGPRTLYYLPTFDPAWSDLSPGKLLLHEVIRSSAERGGTEVDLGPGRDVYKTWWATGERRHGRMLLSKGDPAVWCRYAAEPALRRAGVKAARVVLRHNAIHRHLPTRLRGFADRGIS